MGCDGHHLLPTSKMNYIAFETERLWEMPGEGICHGLFMLGSAALYPDNEKKLGQDHKPMG
jgi:hypothetical protein